MLIVIFYKFSSKYIDIDTSSELDLLDIVEQNCGENSEYICQFTNVCVDKVNDVVVPVGDARIETVNINVTDSGVTNVTERDVEVELIEELKLELTFTEQKFKTIDCSEYTTTSMNDFIRNTSTETVDVNVDNQVDMINRAQESAMWIVDKRSMHVGIDVTDSKSYWTHETTACSNQVCSLYLEESAQQVSTSKHFTMQTEVGLCESGCQYSIEHRQALSAVEIVTNSNISQCEIARKHKRIQMGRTGIYDVLNNETQTDVDYESQALQSDTVVNDYKNSNVQTVVESVIQDKVEHCDNTSQLETYVKHDICQTLTDIIDNENSYENGT